MKLNLPSKLVEKLLSVPVTSFCKIFIPSYVFDALFCQNWPFSPPNHTTLRISLIPKQFSNKVEEHIDNLQLHIQEMF
jgi:hypothetical protein